jgi:hypothetical protein
MSSSCFQNFVIWLSRVRVSEREEQYQIAFLANDAHDWQRRSLHALGCFAPDQVVIR